MGDDPIPWPAVDDHGIRIETGTGATRVQPCRGAKKASVVENESSKRGEKE